MLWDHSRDKMGRRGGIWIWMALGVPRVSYTLDSSSIAASAWGSDVILSSFIHSLIYFFS